MEPDRRVAVISGASHGIGRAVALVLARRACDVVFCYSRDREGAVETVRGLKELGSRGIAIQADVSSADGADVVVATAVEEFGRVDILVNNAAVVTIAPLVAMQESEWDRVVDVNLKGYFLMGRAVARALIGGGRGGRIVNVGSVLGEWPLPGRSHYCATKAGIVMLTKVWAVELAPYGITVNAVEPGTIESEMTAPMLASEEQRQAMIAPIPLARLGTGGDIGEAVAFLVSDVASYITGAVLIVDGGLTISPKQ